MNYVSVAEARKLQGLRIAFTRGFPGPWGMAAKAILDIKGIPYISVLQEAGAPNPELKEWTGQTSAPVIMLNDERPRAHWSEILLLAERIIPEPRLIPEDEDERALMFGLCHELCGEDGLGWTLRELVMAALHATGNIEENYTGLIHKFKSGRSTQHAARRLNTLIDMLERRLSSQKEKGGQFFIGRSLTAADIYWACFSNMLHLMPPEWCVAPENYDNDAGGRSRAHLAKPVPQILMDHRNRVVKTYFKLPIDF
jgi:glutathione S-transferase